MGNSALIHKVIEWVSMNTFFMEIKMKFVMRFKSTYEAIYNQVNQTCKYFGKFEWIPNNTFRTHYTKFAVC